MVNNKFERMWTELVAVELKKNCSYVDGMLKNP